MTEWNETNRNGESYDDDILDLGLFLHDVFRGLKKFWWVIVLLTAVFGAAGFGMKVSSYRPMYKCEATFTVSTLDSNSTNYYYSFYYDQATAEQMAATFPYILDSDLLMDLVKKDLGVEYLNGSLSASAVESSNLFTLAVVSAVPEDALGILKSVIRNYPTVAEYVIGEVQLNMIEAPKLPSEPYNSMDWRDSSLKCGLIGLALGLALLILYALTRNTIRKEEEIKEKLHTQCLGIVPHVVFKKRSDMEQRELSVQNDRTGDGFQESFRSISLELTRLLQEREKRVVMVTSTETGEGVSSVSSNLSITLASQGKHVLLLDGHFSEAGKSCGANLERFFSGQCQLSEVVVCDQKTGIWTLSGDSTMDVRNQSRIVSQVQKFVSASKRVMDYIIIDAPAVGNLRDISPVLEMAEAVLYVIRQDTVSVGKIMDCFEDLDRYEPVMLGCIINDTEGGLTGYGYGYGYSKYGRYGQYVRYGYYGDSSKHSKKRS